MRGALLPLLLLTLAFPAGAAEGCVPGASDAETVEGHHVVMEPCERVCRAALFVYRETNGIDGLQRKDSLRDDTCGGAVAPDALVALVYVARL